MTEKISRVLVVLASSVSESDIRANVVNNLCKSFAEACQTKDIEVDLIDLYKDDDFNPIYHLDEKDTKVLEYQIRLKKAQLIVFFHPVWWLSVPAILKGFLDKVLVNGFSFQNRGKTVKGLLGDKKAIVFAVSDKPVWQLKYIHGNIINNFWKKGVLDYCGIKNSVQIFGSFRAVSEEEIEKWQTKVENIALNLNNKESSALDLF
jgi:NAD(P)H dehydrogenase (quinone)